MNSSKEISIVKQFKTETAHIVRGAVSERCKFNIHGHSYLWEVCITGFIDPKNGMLLDFKELTPIKKFIDKFDHATVFWSLESDEIISFFKYHFKRVLVMNENTTAENMARLVHKVTSDWLAREHNNVSVKWVRVWETTTGSAIATSSDTDDYLEYDFTLPAKSVAEAKQLPMFDEVLN